MRAAPSGAPLAATVYVKPPTAAGKYVPFKAGASGSYARALLPGKSYTLVFSAPGYQTQEVAVALPASGGAAQDVTLQPLAGGR